MKLLNIIFLLVFVANISNAQNKNINNFATINVDSAYSLIQVNYLNPDFIILDVRQISEYNTKHIENAVELNYYASNFNDVLDTLIKDKIYLIHCASGSRSTNTFNTMQTMDFTQLYNMSGGINAWDNAGYPVTTEVAPIIVTISDTLLEFNNTTLFSSDTLQIVFTNFGNDTLKFTNITDISSSEFSINIDINHTLTGLMDYTFNVIYSPIDLINDSIVFQIESNGGDLQYVLKGKTIITNIYELSATNIKLYPNPTKQNIFIDFYKIIDDVRINIKDILGRNVVSNNYGLVSNVNLKMPEKEGIYFVEIISNNNILATKKVVKL